MPDTPADTLIVTLAESETLPRLAAAEHGDELRYLSKLRDGYGRVIVVGQGCPQALPDWLEPVSLTDEPGQTAARVVEMVQDAPRVVIRAGGPNDDGVGVLLTRLLHERGVHHALVVRMSHIASRALAQVHGPDSPQAMAAGEAETQSLSLADAVLASTGADADLIAWRYGLAAGRVAVVPHVVRDDLDPVVESEQRDRTLILGLGGPVAKSRVPALLSAAAELSETLEPVRIVVPGEGPERDELITLARELGVDAEFPGRLSSEAWYDLCRRAGVACCASAFETSPTGVYRAMALGCCVVVADAPGLSGVVENGVTGIRVPGSPDSFAYALAGVLPDNEWRQQLGVSASNQTLGRMGMTAVASNELEVHRKACALDSASTPLTPATGAADEGAPRRWPLAWDDVLVHMPADRASDVWARSIDQFAEQLPEAERARFLGALSARRVA